MKTNLRWAVSAAVIVCICSTLVFSQQDTNPAGGSVTTAAAQLPRLVKFGGMLRDLKSNPLTGITGVTFALYSQQTGGAPLWLETQNVQPDKGGHYVVMLGSTKPDGLEMELFVSEQAQWLGIQAQGQEEQPRVLLVSVPYALKAGDAETLGGKPASAFMPASVPATSAGSASTASNPISSSGNPLKAGTISGNITPAGSLTGNGTANYIPKWTTASNLGNSKIFQSTTGDVGIGTAAPTATLDVSGTSFLSGLSSSTFALTVYSPAQLAEVIEGPVSGVGAGLDLKATGVGGKQWEILATGKTAIQGVGKFNIRDVTTSTDALTIDSSDNVNVRNLTASAGISAANLAASDTVNALKLNADSASLGSSGMVSVGPVGIGPEFQTKLPGQANLDVQGDNRDILIGDPGCGRNFAGIGFQNAPLSNCGNYSMVGDGSDTYVGAPTGNIYFRTQSNTVTPMIIGSSGSVGVGTIAPNAKLDVRGQAGDSGFGIAADNNAWQARGAGGWVKAMAYVDPFVAGGIAITRCYNSQATGATVTTPPCGISIVHNTQGDNTLDFGFQVSDRFVQLTAVVSPASQNAGASLVGATQFAGFGATATQIDVYTFKTNYNGSGFDGANVDTPFLVFVY
jgi:trimeric autotransporter adhesin